MHPVLPPFLRLASQSRPEIVNCYSGVFRHNRAIAKGDVHIRWWPSKGLQPRVVLLFIPGNPGLIDFYIPFLSSLHESLEDHHLAILAHAHLGHTPHLRVEKSRHGLLHQVESAIETLDSIKAHYPSANVVITGHSVGCWVAMQVLKARPDDIKMLFFLFPTISHLAKTPNGRRLAWAFRSPIPFLASFLSPVIRPFSPFLFPQWPQHQRDVLKSLLSSPRSIFACLTMAHEEMNTIMNLDALLLKENSHKIWVCYADKDDWVGDERNRVVQSLGPDAAIRVVDCEHGIPHSFCISHSEPVAAQCAAWFRSARSRLD